MIGLAGKADGPQYRVHHWLASRVKETPLRDIPYLQPAVPYKVKLEVAATVPKG